MQIKKAPKTLVSLAAVVMMLGSCGSTTSDVHATESIGKKTWSETYDALITEAQGESDSTKRFNILHTAEDRLMDTGACCPIYYYTEKTLRSSKISGFYETASGYKFFKHATKSGSDTITACIASEPDHIDPALSSSVDAACYICNAFEGLMTFDTDSDGNVKLVYGNAVSYTKKTVDGVLTYDFTMRDGLKWSDGSDLNAKDYVYAWNRAASGATGADYGYLYGYIKNYDAVAADTTGTEKLGISSSEDGKHFIVKMDHDCPYFEQLLAFPTFMPVKQSVVEAHDDWATSYDHPEYFVSNGAFNLTGRVKDSNLTFTKNSYYYNASKTGITTLKWALSDNSSTNLTNFAKGDYDYVDGVPVAKMDSVKAQYGESGTGEFHITSQLGTYYVAFNMNSTVFDKVANTESKRSSLRKGLTRLIDRNNIVNNVTKGGEVAANTMVDAGISDADGVTKYVTKANNGNGYYSVDSSKKSETVAAGVQYIKDAGYNYDESTGKFTDVPTFTYLYNTSDSHKAIAEAIQADLANYGINMNLKNMDWSSFLTARKAGEFDVAREGWLADYDDPSSYLEMFISSSGNNDAQLGKDWHASYDGYEAI